MFDLDFSTQSVSSRTQILAVFSCGLFLLMQLYLIRKNRIKPGHAIMWIVFGFSLLLFALFNQLLDLLSLILGVFYPPAAFFVVIIGALILVLIHFSIIMTKQEQQIIHLTQEVGLMKNRLRKVMSLQTETHQQKIKKKSKGNSK